MNGFLSSEGHAGIFEKLPGNDLQNLYKLSGERSMENMPEQQ